MNPKLKQLFINDPDMLRLIEQRDANQLLKSIVSRPAKDIAREIMIELLAERFLKDEKGDPGKDGYTPIKGKDYFDGKSIKGDDGYTPIKGKDYFTEREVKAFIDRVSANIPPFDTAAVSQSVYDRLLSNKASFFEPISSIVAKINIQKNSIEPDVIKGWGSITPESVVELIKKKKLLGTKDIKGMPLNMNDMRWHGGGLSVVSHDATLTGDGTPSSPLVVVGGGGVTPTSPTSGTVNGTTVDFVFTTKPALIISDGATLRENFGWTWSGSTATLSVAPEFDLFGI